VSDPVGDFRSCIEETIFLLEALRMAAKPPLLVFPSSAAVYGEPKSLPIKESDPTIPLSPYGVSKLATENYIAVYCRLYGLRSVCFRPFSLYGPYQKQLVIFDFINKLNANPKRLEVLGDGNQQRDFLYIDDFISLMLYACDPLSPPGYSETYNAASGISYSIRELLAVVCDVMELSPQIIYSNINRPGDPLKWAVDVTKIRRLGFSSATPLSAGLRQVLNWFYTENISELSTKERY
jgi:UDP-glucose 4-epimerase